MSTNPSSVVSSLRAIASKASTCSEIAKDLRNILAGMESQEASAARNTAIEALADMDLFKQNLIGQIRSNLPKMKWELYSGGAAARTTAVVGDVEIPVAIKAKVSDNDNDAIDINMSIDPSMVDTVRVPPGTDGSEESSLAYLDEYARLNWEDIVDTLQNELVEEIKEAAADFLSPEEPTADYYSLRERG